MLDRDQMYVDLLKKSMGNKPIIKRYSPRHKICGYCPDRLKCVTNSVKGCLTRKKVDKEMNNTKRFFRTLFK